MFKMFLIVVQFLIALLFTVMFFFFAFGIYKPSIDTIALAALLGAMCVSWDNLTDAINSK